MITQQDILNVAAELIGVVNDFPGEISAVLADVNAPNRLVNENVLGDKANLVRSYLAAHLLAMRHPELAQVSQVRGFERRGVTDPAGYGYTRFGREYLRLTKLSPIMLVVG